MSAAEIRPAFELEAFTVALDRLVPSRPVNERLTKSAKYRALLSSINEVGLVEPLSVYPQERGTYLILDGHARVEALRELGQTEALCLKALRDEGYTYNQKVNRIAPIQANRMILKALSSGVPEERIARALNLSIHTVRSNRTLLQGLCPEALELLRDKEVAQGSLRLLKKVKPLRQIEIAEMMVATGTYTVPCARTYVLRTSKDQLVEPEDPRRIPGLKPEDLARIEHEMHVLEKDFKALDETYNEQVMSLTIARGYLRQLLENGKVVKYLSKNFREFLAEFQRIVETDSLET